MCSLDLSLIVPSSINSEWPRFLSFPFSSASGKQLVEPVSGKKTFENVFALCTLSVFYYCSLERIRMVCGRKVAQKRLARIERHSRPWSWTDHAVNDMLKPKTFFFNFNLIFTTPINICPDPYEGFFISFQRTCIHFTTGGTYLSDSCSRQINTLDAEEWSERQRSSAQANVFFGENWHFCHCKGRSCCGSFVWFSRW